MRENIYKALGDIDETYIREAKQIRRTRNPVWRRWGLAAACLLVMVVIVLGDFSATMVGGVKRYYKNISISENEIARTWPWEYLTTPEKYGIVIFENREYRLRGEISEDLLGEDLGNGTARGYDTATQETHTETFEVRRLDHIFPEYMVAVKMEDVYYVSICVDNGIPSTFGEVMDIYGLPYTLEFRKAGQLAINDDSYIWQILSECRDARAVENGDDWQPIKRKYLSFTVTSEALGVYKRVFYVSEDGYIWTNIFDHKYEYEIGVEAAEKILSYVKNNSTVAEYEPFEYRFAGKLTEIGEGYVRIDDSVMCLNPLGGMVFHVPVEDMWIRRLVELDGLQVGDIIVVTFCGEVDVERDNTISGVMSIEKGNFAKSGAAAPE